jgi:UDP-N-acetylglucosamine 3-dehydrogenase
VIGLGLMGQNHVRVYSELDDAVLVAAADPDPEATARASRGRLLRTYADYREMLDREQLDAISIAVPTSQHRGVALEVIQRGLDLLIEKPIAASSWEAREIIRQAATHDTILAIGHIERFNPAVMALHEQLLNGSLGHVFEIKARRTGPFPERVKDVGVVIDLATHDLDLMLKLTGAEIERMACEITRNVHTHYEDTLLALLRFSNATIASLDVNWLSPTKVRDLTVIGARGMFLVDYLTQQLSFYENGTVSDGWDQLARLSGVSEGRMIRLVTERTEPLRAELQAFVRSVRDGSQAAVTGQDGLKALLVAEDLLRVAGNADEAAAVDAHVPVVAGR